MGDSEIKIPRKNIKKEYGRLKKIYENIEQGIYLNEIVYENKEPVNYRIIDANSACEVIFGISLSKMIGSLASEVFNLKGAPFIENCVKVVETGKTISFKEYFEGKYLLITITNLEKNKFIILIHNLIEDQQIKQSESNCHELFNRAPIGMFISSSKGKLLSINNAMVKMLGCKDVNEAITYYQKLSEKLYKKSGRRKGFLRKLKVKGEVKNFEFEAIRIDGKHIWLSVNARISKINENGSLVIAGYVFNITERKRYEKQLHNQKKELLTSYEKLAIYNEETTAINEELEEAMSKVNNLNKRYVNMINLTSNLRRGSKDKNKNFLSELLKTAIKIVPEADYGKICLFDEEDCCRFIDTVGHDLELIKTTKIKKEILFNFSNINNEDIYLSDKYSLDLSRLSSDKRKIFEKALKPIVKSIYINIKFKSDIVGRIILDIAKGSNKEFSSTTKHLLESFASLGSAFFSFEKYNQLQSQFNRELIMSIIQILEMYDKYTSGHSRHVAELGADIAEKLGLSKEEVEATYWAGMVHDLGKLLVPLNILNKKYNLTDREYDIIKKHPYWSYKVLNNSENLSRIAKFVLYHHERWDGKGYPKGLKGNEIPIVSQILTIVDAWDAMTSERSYRRPLSKEEAIDEIIKNKGTQFSPELVEVFLEYKKKLMKIQ